MATLAQMLAAVLISLLIGIPLGIIAGRSRRFAAAIAPVLDAMQIMPTLAYLGPMTLLFGIGVAPGTIATLIYAIPPAIRITALGIRGVPRATMEAAESLGSTRWQTLSKVQLPLARRTIGIGVNQTIMMALSMVVITALIGAPGLGVDVLRALQSVNVGAAFQAGLAIVILAIVLDRLTERAGEWMDPRFRRAGETRRQRRIVAAIAAGVVVLAVLFARTLADPTAFPETVFIDFRDPVNDIVGWIKTNLVGFTNAIKDAFSYGILNPLQEILTQAPWLLVLAVVFVSAWYVSRTARRHRRRRVPAPDRRPRPVGARHGDAGERPRRHADHARSWASLIGIVSARNDPFRSTIRPLLDAAQTLPAFVYLIPAVALFSVGRFTAIVAAVIYAVPPVIRLVDAGIRCGLADGPRGRPVGRVDGAPAALEGPAAPVAAGAAPGGEPGHRHGPRDGRRRRPRGCRRARVRRHLRVHPARGLRQGPGRRRRDRAARHHARSDHPGRGRAPIDGGGPRGIAFGTAAVVA